MNNVNDIYFENSELISLTNYIYLTKLIIKNILLDVHRHSGVERFETLMLS